jgi:hypothetical protein
MVVAIIAGEYGEIAAGCRNCELHLRGGYLRNPWNLLDWTVVALWAAQSLMYLRFEARLRDATAIIIRDAGAQISRRAVMVFVKDMEGALLQGTTVRTMSMPVLLCLVLRMIKSCKQHPKLYFITKTIEVASGHLVPFSLVFLIVFYCFAESGVVLFGAHLEEFSSVYTAWHVLFDMLLGTYDYGALPLLQPTYGPLFIWIYYLLCFFLMLNMLLAIVRAASLQTQSAAACAPVCVRVLNMLHGTTQVMDAYKQVKGAHQYNRVPIQPHTDTTAYRYSRVPIHSATNAG